MKTISVIFLFTIFTFCQAQFVPLPKEKPAETSPAQTVNQAVTTTAPALSGMSHQEIVDELLFEVRMAEANGEDTRALKRLITRHQKAMLGTPPTQPFLGGSWVDAETGASFSVYQEVDKVVAITESLGGLEELWERLEGLHNGKSVAFAMDDATVKVAIEDNGKTLSWGPTSKWQKIPSLQGNWADPAKKLVFNIAQQGTDLLITMLSEEGKQFWTSLSATQRGDRLIIEYKDGLVSTVVDPGAQVIFWADEAKTRWVKLTSTP